MNKLFVLIVVLSLVAIDGCSKKEEGAGEPGGKNGAVSNEAIQTASEGQTEAKPKPKLLAGEIGSSSRWGSGWLDRATVTDFAAGDVLLLRIGGTASKVLVRLLPEGKFPDSSVGIVGGGGVGVPGNRIVEVVLDNGYAPKIYVTVVVEMLSIIIVVLRGCSYMIFVAHPMGTIAIASKFVADVTLEIKTTGVKVS